MNACNLTKRRGKRVLLCVKEENLCDFDSEKDQKKKKKRVRRDRERNRRKRGQSSKEL